MTIPPEFKIIEKAISYRTVKEGVTSDDDGKGEFSYGMIIEAKVPAYKENDLITLMEEKFKKKRIQILMTLFPKNFLIP